jgi:pimeloyl-ACP methyl ester carboxylesterase
MQHSTAIFENDGIRFTYETEGEGDPVVLLHGLGGDRAQSLGLVPPGPWRRVAIDLRGHGDTEPVGREDAFDFPTFADDVAHFLDHVGIETGVLGGVSMGAGVALRFALNHPERVVGLLLIRPAWLHEPIVKSQPWDREIADLLLRHGPAEGERIFRTSEWYASTREVSEYAAESLCHQFTDRDAMARVHRLIGLPRSAPYEHPSDLERVSVPALIVGAERDPQHPLEFAREWADGLPDARFAEVTSKAVDPDLHNREVQIATDGFLRGLLRGVPGK